MIDKTVLIDYWFS